MKYKFLSLITAILIVTLSCENEFDINDEWEDVTVVYGLLDPAADTNWIRVQRGYLGPGPASASFNNPDSLYYDSADVILESFELNANGTLGSRQDSFVLIRDETSRQLQQGPFTGDGFHLYRTDSTLSAELAYKLTVTNKKEGSKENLPDASATTELVSAFDITTPRAFDPIMYSALIRWNQSAKASIYEIDIYFHYEEYDIKTGTSENKMVKVDYATVTSSSFDGKMEYNPQLDALYKAIGSKIEADDSKLRFFQKMKIDIWAGGEDLYKYMALNKPSGGINESKPEFPGIENGIGLFSSRTKSSLDNVIFPPSSSSQIAGLYYLSDPLCALNFAVLEGADTCKCQAASVGSNEKICF